MSSRGCHSERARFRRRCRRGLAGSAWIGLCLLWIAPAQADSAPHLTLPETLHAQVVAGALRVHGIPTRILAFRASRSADALADYFAGQWANKMHRSRAGRWTVLSHRDGAWLTTIQIRKASMGQTRGFIAMSPLFKAIEDGRRPPEIDIPMLHGTTVVNDLQATDHGKQSRTLVLRSTWSASQNLDFYRAYFKEQGYVPVGPGALVKGDTGGGMILNRGNERLDLAATQAGQTTLITIVRVQQP